MIKRIEYILDKHRSSAMFTCEEDCLCWEIETLLQALAEKDKDIKELENEVAMLEDLNSCEKCTTEISKMCLKAETERDALQTKLDKVRECFPCGKCTSVGIAYCLTCITRAKSNLKGGGDE